MMFKRKKISPIEKEFQKIEKEEQKLQLYANNHDTAPLWKSKLEERIPEKVMTGLRKAYFKAFCLIFEKGTIIIERTYDKDAIEKEFKIKNFAVDVKGDRREIKRFQSDVFKSSALNTVITTAEGIGLGAFGIGLPDIVIWVGVLLRGVYETALKYGFEYESPAEKMFILKLIEASMMNGESWENLNAELDDYISREAHEIPDAIMVKEQIEKTADALAMEMLVTKFIQGMPIAGVLGGAANPIYYHKIMKYVQMKYWKRYLLGKYKTDQQ